MVGHVVLAIHIVNSLETNRAGPISRQILVLSEHSLFTLKGKGTCDIHIYCTVRAWIMPTLCPFLAVPWVDLQSVIMAVLGHSLSFFETIIIVDDNTIVLHKIEL